MPKRTSGWDRPGLQSGGSGILGLQTAGQMPPHEDRREPSARFAPGGTSRPHSARAPQPAACTPRAHLARPRLLLRPGGARRPSIQPRPLRR